MFDVTTWLKTWTGALLACLLVLAVAAPSLRLDFCPPETSVTAEHGAAAEAASFAQIDDQDASDVSDAKGGEQGGHCHHVPQLLNPVVGAQHVVSADRIRLVASALDMPASRMPDGPNEPPRA
ncbi:MULTISPECIES: hypothetical protein [Caulobacter]|jgi:hypothetical protein|uniref:Uncharacterized protein n=1 Tax=Caulobacter vibrioides OR37 TaxID=1292034 RepID=R0EP83_CAUVI|nr:MULTISPECIES: hypothetical protein [Caulobacter]ENZ82867.1 hypothetical protein OR37_01061 [Caulobacter vibrioides OR37]PIB96903.1 hypothetical protein CSW60_20690 [Caulobacter sp. X]